MNILFLTDNFPPESNAPANRTYEHALHWVQAGHKVTVITCFPNFPDGVVYPGYRNSWYKREEMSGISVIRVKTYITANERFLKRTLDYISFMMSGLLAGIFLKKPDVIVATSPQFFCGVAGMCLSWIRRVPFVLEVRDLWPDSIVALGVMADRLTIRLLVKLERLLYRQASAIIVVTEAFKTEISSRVKNPGKISTVLNGVEPEFFRARSKPAELENKLNLSDQFVVGYIGTHGLAHDLTNVLDAAAKLKSNPNISFLLVGSGAESQKLVEKTEREKLPNVIMLAQQPRDVIPDMISLCDVMLVPLRDEPLFATVIPSKLFECMSMGVPVITALPEGEATQIVLENDCGVVSRAANPDLLAAKINTLYLNPNELQRLGQNGLAASKRYSRKTMAHLMLDVLVSIKCAQLSRP